MSQLLSQRLAMRAASTAASVMRKSSAVVAPAAAIRASVVAPMPSPAATHSRLQPSLSTAAAVRSFTTSAPLHFAPSAATLAPSARPASTSPLYGHWGFTADQEALRELVAKFAASEIAPRAAEIDKTNDFPADLWKKFGDLGLLGITVSEEDGGQRNATQHSGSSRT